MASLQLLLKEKDELDLLGPRCRGRKTAPLADRITEALLRGYRVPQSIAPETKFTRTQVSLSGPIMKRLEQLSRESGLSVCFIVRNILGLDY
jgi:hypothetical protein